MVRPEVAEEILALESIFCNPGEFNLLIPSSLETIEEYQGAIFFKITVKCSGNEDSELGLKSSGRNGSSNIFVVEMSVMISPNYPRTVPEISLSCTEMTKKNMSLLRDQLNAHAANLISSSSGPIIMDLTLWLQENAGLCRDEPELARSRSVRTGINTIVLIKLDHMRNKPRYLKLISRWVEELTLNGRIFFLGNLIFILITGECENVKKYLCRHKTCNVDVDSSGKPCKERMMNVLMQQESSSNDLRMCDFQEVKCQSPLELKERFSEINLDYLYEKYIKPLVTY